MAATDTTDTASMLQNAIAENFSQLKQTDRVSRRELDYLLVSAELLFLDLQSDSGNKHDAKQKLSGATLIAELARFPSSQLSTADEAHRKGLLNWLGSSWQMAITLACEAAVDTAEKGKLGDEAAREAGRLIQEFQTGQSNVANGATLTHHTQVSTFRVTRKGQSWQVVKLNPFMPGKE